MSNQHDSRRRDMLALLHTARALLADGYLASANACLANWRTLMAAVPASTRRRWKCGR